MICGTMFLYSYQSLIGYAIIGYSYGGPPGYGFDGTRCRSALCLFSGEMAAVQGHVLEGQGLYVPVANGDALGHDDV